MIVTSRMDVRPRTVPGVAHVAARTAVALPPSDLDPVTTVEDTAHYGLLRLRINGVLITRAFDSNLDQP